MSVDPGVGVFSITLRACGVATLRVLGRIGLVCANPPQAPHTRTSVFRLRTRWKAEVCSHHQSFVRSAIDPLSMADFEDINYLSSVVNAVDNPVSALANPIPLLTACQFLAPSRPRVVFESVDAPDDPLAFFFWRERFDFLDCGCLDPNAISRHAASAASQRPRMGHSFRANARRKRRDLRRPRPDSL
jgi:hypothetical protein